MLMNRRMRYIKRHVVAGAFQVKWHIWCSGDSIIEHMRYRGMLWLGALTVVVSCCLVGIVPLVAAETSSSTNYKVTETEFGSSSNNEVCHGQYCSRTSLGDIVAGTSGTAMFGPITPDIPTLEVIVEPGPGPSHLGVLTTDQTATRTMKVKVRSYLSNGYFLQITGSAPTYAGHSLETPTTPTASTPGSEQFGINVVANTVPTTFGANPVQTPNSEFSYGEVMSDYATPNHYMYQPGSTVARSNVQSGQTDYTISMIVNVSDKTPAGHYVSDFSAVVVAMY